MTFQITERRYCQPGRNPNRHQPNASFRDDCVNKGPAGSQQTESIFGNRDDRQRVTTNVDFPFFDICRLHMTFSGKSYLGTGFLLFPNLILTAAHNLVDVKGDRPVQASKIEIRSGVAGDLSSHFGADVVNSNSFRYPSRFLRKDESADYGVILLSRNIGKINKQGILVQKVTADLTKTSAVISGYSTIAPPQFASINERGNQQFSHAGYLADNGTFLAYNIETERGQSGSPIMLKRIVPDPATGQQKHYWFAVGIHTDGKDVGRNYNYGIKITETVLHQVLSWHKNR